MPRINKKDKEFFLQERALEIIKKEFDKFELVVDQHTDFFVIAYKKNLTISITNNNNPMQPYESKKDKDVCLLRIISFMDMKETKDITFWLELGCEWSHINDDGFFIEEVRR